MRVMSVSSNIRGCGIQGHPGLHCEPHGGCEPQAGEPLGGCEPQASELLGGCQPQAGGDSFWIPSLVHHMFCLGKPDLWPDWLSCLL